MEFKSKTRSNPWYMYNAAMQKCDAKFWGPPKDGKVLYVKEKLNGGLKVGSARKNDSSLRPEDLKRGVTLLRNNGKLALKCTDDPAVQLAGETIMGGVPKGAPSVIINKDLRKSIHTLSQSPAYARLSDEASGRTKKYMFHATMRNFQDDLQRIRDGAPLFLVEHKAVNVEPEGSAFHATDDGDDIFDSEASQMKSLREMKHVLAKNGQLAKVLVEEDKLLGPAGEKLVHLAGGNHPMTKTKELVDAVDVLVASDAYQAYSSESNWLQTENIKFAAGIPSVSLTVDPYEK